MISHLKGSDEVLVGNIMVFRVFRMLICHRGKSSDLPVLSVMNSEAAKSRPSQENSSKFPLLTYNRQMTDDLNKSSLCFFGMLGNVSDPGFSSVTFWL